MACCALLMGLLLRGLPRLVPILFSTAAVAQSISDSLDRVSSSGEISVVDDSGGWARHLHVGEMVFFAENLYQYVNVTHQFGALYLIEVSDGGNGCGAVYMWLHTEAGTPRLTEESGSCAPAEQVWSDPETVSVSMWAGRVPDQLIAYVYDGAQIEEVSLGLPRRGAGPESDPAEVFRDADWVLMQLLGEDHDDVAPIFELSSGFQQEQDWIMAEARNLDAKAALALHRFDGRIVVAWQAEGSQMALRGLADDLLLETIQVSFNQ